MTVIVPLLPSTLLSNVRYRWTISGIEQSAQISGVSQPSSSFPLFRIILEIPDGAEELLVYDVSDPTNFNLPEFELNLIT